MAALLERAEELASSRPAEAAALYRQAAHEEGTDAEALKNKETAVTKLAELLVRLASLPLFIVCRAMLCNAPRAFPLLLCRPSRGMHRP